jgi:hypothetical protein
MRELERIRDGCSTGNTMGCVNPVAASVCIERKMSIDRVVANERKIDRHWRSRAAAAARLRQTVNYCMRIDE